MNEFLTNAAEPAPAGGMQAAIVPASAAGERFDANFLLIKVVSVFT